MVIAGGRVGSSTVVYWSRLRRCIGVPPDVHQSWGSTTPKASSGASSRQTWSPSTRPSIPCTSPEGMRVWPCTYVQVPLSDEESMRVPLARDNVYCRHTVLPACTCLSIGESHVEGC